MSKIVYIDDEANLQAMISKFEVLKEEGFEVIPVVSVSEALQVIAQHRDSLKCIILDVIMPPRETYSLDETKGGAMTGVRLLKDIRKEYKNIPVIIVTVVPCENTSGIIEPGQIVEYVEKPVNGSTLATILRRVINGGKDHTK